MKKGFTLVEIILSIALITVIGVSATIGFIQYNKYSKEKTLNNMSNEILTALRVYIETDSEAKSRIYEDYQGMAITLETLESEGLIDFGDLDVKDDYVVAMLSNESDCSDITTVKSWDLSNGPLYICSKSNGSQNLFAVGGDAENLSQTTREPYYFRGADAKNYVSLKGDDTLYKILSVETDDSLVLATPTTQSADCSSSCTSCFESLMCSNTLPASYGSYSTTISGDKSLAVCKDNKVKTGFKYSNSSSNGIARITSIDVANTMYCHITPDYSGSVSSRGLNLVGDTSFYINSYALQDDGIVHIYIRTNAPANYKIHLNPKFKITSGSGDISTPYIIEKTS